MARTYILKEPQHVRDDVTMTVALLRYVRVFSNGDEINPTTAEVAARYDRILEKIDNGLPLAEIIELREIAREVEEAEERRRIFRGYKKELRAYSVSLASQLHAPTRADVICLLNIMERSPLLTDASSQPSALTRLIEIFKRHPHLAYDEYINCRYIRHLLATDFCDDFYIRQFFDSLRMRYASAAPSFRFYDGYSLDFPKLVALSDSIFCFTGRFHFGSRRKCREAVVLKGGTWTEAPTASTDFLVVAANGENTSPDSTKVSACMALKSKGCACFMLAEEFWLAHINHDTKAIDTVISAYGTHL